MKNLNIEQPIITGFLTKKKIENNRFKIALQARKDFKEYKDVIVRFLGGREAKINRRGIEKFFGVEIAVSDLPYGYPNCFIIPVVK